MKHGFTLLKVGLLTAILASPGCETVEEPYNSLAYRPQNINNVKVKVSLNHKMAYVLEGNRALLVTPVTIGTAQDPTPKGDFKVFRKWAKKRSYTYGFHVNEAAKSIRPGMSKNLPSGSRYVGYPMPYWVEFKAGYGFHEGGVWPTPRSHGCLRVHKNVAPKFYHMVKEGTPINIADSQPEDFTIGKNVKRPTDYADPDPPASFLITDKAFTTPAGPLFEEGPAPLAY